MRHVPKSPFSPHPRPGRRPRGGWGWGRHHALPHAVETSNDRALITHRHPRQSGRGLWVFSLILGVMPFKGNLYARELPMARPIPVYHDFVGQRRIVMPLMREVRGAKAKGEPCSNMLITGPSGLGKSHLARSVAAEYGTHLHTWPATSGLGAAYIAEAVLNLEPADFIFIDEIHRLAHPGQELLYRLIDEQKAPALAADMTGSRTQVDGETEIQKVTLVGATDQPGRLANALIRRIPRRFVLKPYSLREMIYITRKRASSLGISLTPQAARTVATISRGIPRTARHHLENLRHYFGESGIRSFNRQHVREFMRAHQIDERGMGPIDRGYLLVLNRRQAKVARHSMALALGVDDDYVADQIEPWLVQQGWVNAGPSGRELTSEGRSLADEIQRRRTKR